MQKPRRFRPGDLVRVRQSRWRVDEVRAYDACSIVTLTGTADPVAEVVRRVVTPAETIEPIETTRRPRFISRSRWRHSCRAAIANGAGAATLITAADATIDLLPYQLEPALAMLRGAAMRMLLADEVGLGKTVQAGLIASELIARRLVDRLLVLTPAGLRDQWVEELQTRFRIGAVRVDARSMRHAAAALPVGVNPWFTVPFAVASIDYVKRPEVTPAVTAIDWHLVIVDEAHAVAGESDRRAVADAIAGRAAYVLLLTATPHNGDRGHFASLCAIGSADDAPLVVFRRRRAQVGIASRRRVHVLRVGVTPLERRMHGALARYAAALRAEAGRRGADIVLALGILHKRMFSSAWSLAQSVERRLLALAAHPAGDAEQLFLPLAEGETTTADAPPTWPMHLRLNDAVEDRRLLKILLSAALDAAERESKLRVLGTLLRRSREPAIVFTEYRDTLMHIRSVVGRRTCVLHGGMARDERMEALRAFAAAPDGILLATDAAAEGLNLHAHCRLVVNVELPWNPARLEQRIGRVDRIGQSRTVHAFHLVSAAAGESLVLDRLRARIAAAASDIDVANPLGDPDDEHAIASAVARCVSNDEYDDG